MSPSKTSAKLSPSRACVIACLLNFEGEAEGKTTDEIITNVIETLPAEAVMA